MNELEAAIARSHSFKSQIDNAELEVTKLKEATDSFMARQCVQNREEKVLCSPVKNYKASSSKKKRRRLCVPLPSIGDVLVTNAVEDYADFKEFVINKLEKLTRLVMRVPASVESYGETVPVRR